MKGLVKRLDRICKFGQPDNEKGANASEKFLSLFAVLPGGLQSFWPSLHPLDLLVGLCCGAGLRLAVYLKSKNAKKYRHGMAPFCLSK